MKLSIHFLFILLVGLQFSFAQQNTEIPKTIPDFQYINIKKDNIFSNTDLPKKGQTLIIFYTTECIHCQIAVQHLNENFEKFKNTNVVMITTYDKEAINKFIDEYASNMKDTKNVTWLQDSEDEFLFTFNRLSFPSFYLYDKDKNLVTYKKGSIEFREVFEFLK